MINFVARGETDTSGSHTVLLVTLFTLKNTQYSL